MGLFFFKWSKTAASNATADAQINMAEGMAPSAVNDGVRALMASAAGYRDDISGSLITTGTGTAYALTTNQIFDSLANMQGTMIAFTPNLTNTGAVTLNVDGLGAKPIVSAPDVPLLAGTLILGTPYVVTYRNDFATPAFVLQGFYGSPYSIPLGGMIDFVGTTAPNSAFVIPVGQAISRTTYATLFSLVSTTYGTGDGSTTFNVPDLTGRVVAMKEASATRLTTAGGAIDGGTLGAVGGTQNVTLAANQIPTITATNASQSISVTSSNTLLDASGGLQDFNPASASGFRTANNTASLRTQTSTGSNSISATYTNSSPTVTKTVMPAIILNKILRVI